MLLISMIREARTCSGKFSARIPPDEVSESFSKLRKRALRFIDCLVYSGCRVLIYQASQGVMQPRNHFKVSVLSKRRGFHDQCVGLFPFRNT